MNGCRRIVHVFPFALFAVGLSACIATRSEDEHGEVRFAGVPVPNAADYQVAAGAGAAGLPGSMLPVGGGRALPPREPVVGGSGSAVTPVATAGAPAMPAGAGGPGGSDPPAQGGRGGGPMLGEAGAPSEAGSGGIEPMPPAAGAPASGPTAGTLTVSFTSVNQRGRYAPRNVGAVWIETASGTFVKTLERWAGIRARHLEHWTMKSGGWGSSFFGGGGNTADMMDAVSRATLRNHEMHTVMWNMQDAMGKLVPDGKYNVVVEVTEDNVRPGAWAAIEFEKGAAPQMIMAPDEAPYSGLTIRYQP